MNREELEAVIGHEVSHIRNLDIRISTIAVALASAITLLSSMASRMMWWGGASRSRRNSDRDSGGLEVIMLVIFSLSHSSGTSCSNFSTVSHFSSTRISSRCFKRRINS